MRHNIKTRRSAEDIEAEIARLVAERDDANLAARLQAQRGDKLEAERDRLQAELRAQGAWTVKAAATIDRLRAALEGVLADIADYERVNNLSPSPPRLTCWYSVAIARRALKENQ